MSSKPQIAAAGSEKGDGRELVKELAGAVSTQAQVANRAWLALMTIAAFAVLPRVPKEGTLSLPFSLGDVNTAWFHGTAFFILVALAIAFASAHLQQVRADKLAQSVIDRLATDYTGNDHVHPRDLFDILRQPSLTRMAPLAQSLKGKYQFFSTREGCPSWRARLSAVSYGLFKLAAIVVYDVLPGLALWWSFSLLKVSGGLWVVLLLAGCLGSAALLEVLWVDSVSAVRIVGILRRKP